MSLRCYGADALAIRRHFLLILPPFTPFSLRDVIAPYDAPPARYWRTLLLPVAAADVILLPPCDVYAAAADAMALPLFFRHLMMLPCRHFRYAAISRLPLRYADTPYACRAA